MDERIFIQQSVIGGVGRLGLKFRWVNLQASKRRQLFKLHKYWTPS